jgi:hypothetical protein
VFDTPAKFGTYMMGKIPHEAGTPAFSVLPGNLSFGDVAGGSSKTDTLVVTNTGTATLRLTSVASSNVQFWVSPISANIGPSASANFLVTFSPTLSGTQSASIIFRHNASGSPTSIPVTGEGAGGSFTLPVITSVTPASGPLGTSVAVAGGNFNPTPSNNVVRFGTIQVPVTSASSTLLTMTIPPGISSEPITLLANGLQTVFQSPFDILFSSSHSIDTNSFGAGIGYRAEVNPHHLQAMDIDGDGKPDLVLLNAGSGTLSIYRNVGTPDSLTSSSFAAPVNFVAGGTFPSSYVSILAMGDLDNDGKVDIVVADGNLNRLQIFRNSSTPGSVSFDAPMTIATGLNPYGLAVGDIDGDGKLDLIVGNYGNQTISVFRNVSTPGVLMFGSNVNFTTAGLPYAIAIGDLDGDGKADVVVGTFYGGISIFRNIAIMGTVTNSSFAPRIDLNATSSANEIALRDIDGDGKLDILQLDRKSVV